MEQDLNKKLRLLENSRTKEEVNIEYLKNILTKYLLFTSKNSMIEAKQMESILLDLMHFTKQEKENLERATQIKPISKGFFGFFSRKDKESVPGVTGNYAPPRPGARAQSVQRMGPRPKPVTELSNQCDLNGIGIESINIKDNRLQHKH